MNVKKLLSIVLALSMVLLCACTGTNSQTGADATAAPAATSAATSATETAAPADTGDDSGVNAEGYPIVNEKIDLSVAQCVRDVDELDFDTMAFYQEFEEKTNIHINWEQI